MNLHYNQNVPFFIMELVGEGLVLIFFFKMAKIVAVIQYSGRFIVISD